MIHDSEHSKEIIWCFGMGFRRMSSPSNLQVYVFYNPMLDGCPNRVKTDFQQGHMRAPRLVIKGFA